ncbi:hypothetical protein [Streptomyces sp. NBC_00009]|uniref:hypothetical protein n=1 Tax=Streptomyces sp. NBC_00009 TaxID=2975620 RepID=UPI003246E73B
MDDQRYHLTLTATANGTVMNGWWAGRATAERKFTSWIGSYSVMPGARIALAEQAADGMRIELASKFRDGPPTVTVDRFRAVG